MAKNLFEKINTLIQVHLNQFNPASGLSQLLRGSKKTGLAELDRQFKKLEDEEANQEARIAALNEELLNLDEQADAAVTAGREAEARHLLTQRESARQRLTMLEADLRTFRIRMSELISQRSELEALIDMAQQAESEKTEPEAQAQELPVPETKTKGRTKKKGKAVKISVMSPEDDALSDVNKSEPIASEPESEQDESGIKIKVRESTRIEQGNDEFSARLSRLAKPETGSASTSRDKDDQ